MFFWKTHRWRPSGRERLGLVEEDGADAATLGLGIDVELLEDFPAFGSRAADCEEAEQAAVLLGEPDVLVARAEVVGDQADVLLEHRRDVLHLVAGADEDACECVRLLRSGGSDFHGS